MHRYERWVIRRYLTSALRTSRFAKAPRLGSDVVAWLETHGRSVGLPLLTFVSSIGKRSRRDDDYPLTDGWPQWRRSLIAAGHEAPPKPSGSATADRLAGVGVRPRPRAEFCLWPTRTRDVFAQGPGPDRGRLWPLWSRSRCPGRLRPRAVSGGSHRRRRAVPRRPPRPARSRRRARRARLSNVARRILTMPRLAARRVGDLLLGEPATLGWGDFALLGEMRELAMRMVLAAGSSRARGKPLPFVSRACPRHRLRGRGAEPSS